MSVLEAGYDISDLNQIYPITRNFEQRKNRLGNKMMRLGPDTLTINTLDNIAFRKITGATSNNINSSNQT
jgi:hypothetical protein